MKTDIEIARETKLNKIEDVAEKLGVPRDEVQNYGRYIAKVPIHLIDKKEMEKHNLILVSAITPNKAGVGKTTVSIGLSLGLNKIGKKAVVALREPSLGPCFGMKGGAAGGGYAQVLPMEKINLHFTGDFHAITSAHNMISALLDNYIYQHQADGFGLKEIIWRRVLDVNDRSLRSIVTGLGSRTNGVTLESGFDITPASEIMAILCLAKDTEDLRRRIENIILGFDYEGKPFYSERFRCGGRRHRTAERRHSSQPGTDHRRNSRFCAWWSVRKYSAWLQLHSRYQNGYDLRRLRSDRSRLRCGLGSGEVL